MTDGSPSGRSNGLVTEVFTCIDGGRRWFGPYEIGCGPPFLCLPAPSAISTREDLRAFSPSGSAAPFASSGWTGRGSAKRIAHR